MSSNRFRTTPDSVQDLRFIGLTLCAANLMLPSAAWAYIDPNAGGFLLQLLGPIFAAIVGAWVFLRRWISQKIREIWSRLTGRMP